MKVDVYSSALELAHIFKEEQKLIEKPLLDEGNAVVGVFTDTNFSKSFQGLKEAKLEVLQRAIEEIAGGGGTLLTSQIGIVFREGKVRPFVELLGTSPQGSVIYSLNLKKRKAFHKYKEGDGEEVSQEDINAAVYRLAVELSYAL